MVQSDSLKEQFARRRLINRKIPMVEALVLTCPEFISSWRSFGEIDFLVPGLSAQQVSVSHGAAVIIDEAGFTNGAWAGIAGSAGEDRVVELEATADLVRNTGGTVFGVVRDLTSPDVNIARIRGLYGIRFGETEKWFDDKAPQAVNRIYAVINRELGKDNE